SNDGCAQILIADQGEKGIIDYGTSFWGTRARRSMAFCAENCESGGTAFGIARFGCSVRGQLYSRHLVWPCPTDSHLAHEDFDLFVRQSSTVAFGKSGH